MKHNVIDGAGPILKPGDFDIKARVHLQGRDVEKMKQGAQPRGFMSVLEQNSET